MIHLSVVYLLERRGKCWIERFDGGVVFRFGLENLKTSEIRLSYGKVSTIYGERRACRNTIFKIFIYGSYSSTIVHHRNLEMREVQLKV